MVALLVVWPSVRNDQHRHVDIALYSDGELQVNGETSQIRDLEALLAGFPVRSATVGVGDDVTYGAVDKIQQVLVESGVSLARFERIAGSGSRRKVDLPRFDSGSS
jgi:hypothetical protein